MLFAEARRGAGGAPTATTCRSPSRTRGTWDARLIDEAETLLRRAGTMGAIGRYQLEAAVQSAHVVRRLDRRGRLGGDREALRRAARADRLAGGGDQPRGRGRRDARAPPQALRRSTRCRTMRGSPTISPIGRRAPSCWRGWATRQRPHAPTSGRSVSKAIRPCAVSCKTSADHAWRKRDDHAVTIERASNTIALRIPYDHWAPKPTVRRNSARHARLPAGARHREQRPGRLGRGVLGRLAGHAGRDRALGRAARGRAGHRPTGR